MASSAPLFATIFFFFFFFSSCFANFPEQVQITWGDGRAKIQNNGELLTLSLDNYTGSGFQSYKDYLFASIDLQIKLVQNDSAGTVTAYYLSSQGNNHDEIDFEFLGNVTGQPYVLHTNVFSQGKGDREQRFFLWFDPTANFHTYSIRWSISNILFLVDGVPIREFRNMENEGVPFPKSQAMKLYCSLWNADDWATRGGLDKTDWTKAPFTASFRKLTVNSTSSSSSDNASDGIGEKEMLDRAGLEQMKSLQKKYMIYNYCDDSRRFPQGVPKECTISATS